MKVEELIPVLESQIMFARTPSGRSITEFGKAALTATISDDKNYGAEVWQCKNCKYVNSSLQFPEGCPNCNSKDFRSDVLI